MHISKAAMEEACRLVNEELGGPGYYNVSDVNHPHLSELKALARVLQERSDVAKAVIEYILQRRRDRVLIGSDVNLQSFILPDDEPDVVEELAGDIWLAMGSARRGDATDKLRTVLAGYEIKRRETP